LFCAFKENLYPRSCYKVQLFQVVEPEKTQLLFSAVEEAGVGKLK